MSSYARAILDPFNFLQCAKFGKRRKHRGKNSPGTNEQFMLFAIQGSHRQHHRDHYLRLRGRGRGQQGQVDILGCC